MDKSDINELYNDNFGINLKDCKLLGEGNHGKVYLLTEDRVIKICRDSKSCIFESFILNRVNGNKFFPRIYDFDEHYIVRDYVGGINLRQYIKRNGLSRSLAIKIIELIEEFESLGFCKLDIRCRDIMVQDDGSLMVIDPKGSFTRRIPYPRHLMKGLKKLGVLENFLHIVWEERPDLYKIWNQYTLEANGAE